MSTSELAEYRNPSWYKPGDSGNPLGRPSIKWLKEKVEVVDPETGQTKLQEMADHLIEVATKWEIIHRGEEVSVASARDSVEACRLLWQALSILRKTPPSDEEQVLKLAEHFRQVARDSIDLALKILGERINGMKPEEIAAGIKAFSMDPRGFLDAAEERLGKTSCEPTQALPSAAEKPGDQP